MSLTKDTVDKAAIAAKVKARGAADEVHRLACDEALNHVNEACLAFWKRMLENVCAVLPPEYHPTRVVERGPNAPMTAEESRAFERGTMDFGMHSGKPVAEVPLDYLEWIDEQPNFRRMLNRYLRSKRVQREQDE